MILCDQREVLRHLPTLSLEERRRICQDVLQLFAPVAARLGMYSLKQQLESLSFPVAYATDAVRIAEQLAQLEERCGDFLADAGRQLVTFLKTGGVDARIEGREKQAYSIFRKMSEKGITHVDDLYDLFAMRVIVASEAECYQVLGLLHRIGHPVPNRFKDYIGFPKPNGYQSLHTTVAQLPGVPKGVFVEVQIRTEAMHRESEYGIAAHWSYKEGGSAYLALQRAQLQKALSLQQPIERARSVTPSDHIFVLTPKGDVIELPEGATPLDFAFQVHTGLGLSFKAARVNGSIAPMRYTLENGDVVEILRHHDPKPSPQWLLLLRTATARTRLKRYLAESQRPQMIDAGRESLNEELRRRKIAPLDPDLMLLRSVDGNVLSLAEREDILVSLGQGSMKATSVLPHIDALRTHTVEKKQEKTVMMAKGLQVALEGGIRMPVRFAQCCKPDEGKRSSVIGFVGRGGEVRVHRNDCRMTKNVNPERRMRVKWI